MSYQVTYCCSITNHRADPAELRSHSSGLSEGSVSRRRRLLLLLFLGLLGDRLGLFGEDGASGGGADGGGVNGQAEV